MISPLQRILLDNTLHSQQTNIHAPSGIRTHDRSRRAAVDLRLRPRGYWDRPSSILVPNIFPRRLTLHLEHRNTITHKEDATSCNSVQILQTLHPYIRSTSGREFPTAVSNTMAEVIESLRRQRRVTISQVYLYSGTEFS